ncbi:MAG: hypothetical protein A2219_00925 [Elusimicrobia bacterium RIFOXYA2_FULL_50_26]|nr:MAG: hypothetical protein A2219_00925 [Elusimicrobia bacterium RIFOXYA2_FULL_50_26]OGS23371.1 MAG: hypothetical protein A2314_08175 [Elusimicrobia bacterium RIFOXYB2_FULL_50_12]
MKILIVEDDPELRLYVGQILRNAGYDHECAATIEEYRARIINGCDMALLDIVLGDNDEDGVEICGDIKTNYPSTAIIIVSGKKESDLKVRALNVGADDYISKPFYDDELLSRIRRVALRRNIVLPDASERIRFDDKSSVIYIDGNKISLDKDEYLILKVLNSRGENGVKWEQLRDIAYDGSNIGRDEIVKKVDYLKGRLGNLAQLKDNNGYFSMVIGDSNCVPVKKKKRVLVIDDDMNAQELLSGIFEEEYECFSAYDGNDGLRRIYEVKPDMVILDIRIPGINGYKLCELIKKINGSLPVVFLTGRFVDAGDKSLGLDLGADDYITKDVDPDELLARIKTIVAAYDNVKNTSR